MDPHSSVPTGGLARARDMRRFFRNPQNRIEFAYNDTDLIVRLYRSVWLDGKLYGRDYDFPTWLNETPDIIGDPSRISEGRLDLLREGDTDFANNNEIRYARNKAFIKHIYEQVKSQNQNVGNHHSTTTDPLGATNVTTPQVTTHSAEGSNGNGDDVIVTGSRKGAEDSDDDDDAVFVGSRKVAGTAVTLASISPRSTSSCSMDISESESGTERTPETSQAPDSDDDDDDDVFFVGSRKVARTAVTQASISIRSTSSCSMDISDSESGTTPDTSQAPMPSHTVGRTDEIPPCQSGRLEQLADLVSQELGEVVLGECIQECVQELREVVLNECIQECGQAPLQIIAHRFEEVLIIAYEKLNTCPFSSVQKCWRRLYEDASLFKVVHMLRARVASSGEDSNPNERLKLQNGPQDGDWLSEIIGVLDKSIQLSGAPGRRQLHDTIFQQLSEVLPSGEMDNHPAAFRIYEPSPLETSVGVSKADSTLDMVEFQEWLDATAQPLVIPHVTRHWPASKLWKSPRYLMERTLGGRRRVPVELGKLYTDKDWSQKLMPFADFMNMYLLPSRPGEVGYLAQTELFELIPSLKADIMTPDYCWSTPPASKDEATLKTAGLSIAPSLSEPVVNVWLGPSGTRTPLHTDPYHNILCQIIGFKYVRLYAPQETPKLYPFGVDEKGINMENTSQVDISAHVACLLGRNVDADVLGEVDREFPNFKDAQYQEVILNPGECLYVPLGWWHYVESLTTSFSVSFWWN
ncbi:hypothetical protein NU219Hw_g6804t1 [Hortaea werneckii]